MFEGHPLFSMENVYRAYRRCRRHKRGTVNAMRFERNLEENLVYLHEQLSAGTYQPGKSEVFLVKKPKRREIFAADFRDRVVHHILVENLERKWERWFIHDSYACRKGKGTHAGVERLRSFTRQVTTNGTQRAWYLQLDVRGYFITLNRNILFERISHKERDPAVLWLMQTLIFHEPTENCHLHAVTRADFERLPAHKTLFKAEPHCGLPIGNLTSQFFANVYLDALDQFVKHTLKARHYVRYCDDLVLLSPDKAQLEQWEQEIELFARSYLELEFNDRRKLRPVADGIDFLGYVVRPEYLLVRRRVVSALRQRLVETEKTLGELGMAEYADGHNVFIWSEPLIQDLHQWLNAYFSHMHRASSRRIVQAILQRFAWLNEYFHWESGKPSLRYRIPRNTLRFGQQISRFEMALAGHVLLIRVGKFWQLSPGSIRTIPNATEINSQLKLRFHEREERTLRRFLWQADVPVAWIGETSRRIGVIAERALICRWGVTKRDPPVDAYNQRI
jgi:hypothetical protein